jgi:hypothetical protein
LARISQGLAAVQDFARPMTATVLGGK